LDVGERRIGLATADSEIAIAIPSGFIDRDNSDADYERVVDLAQGRNSDSIVVGMPYTIRGERGHQAKIVEDFIRELRKYSSLPIVAWDERFTSTEADRILRRPRTFRSRAAVRHYVPGVQDATAAVLILQGYLDAQARIEEGL
jgi:putative Holliday junction resolvase